MARATIQPTAGHLLKQLRGLMQAANIDIHAYIVPSGDAHQSEYIADCDMRRQFISKFTGSAGSAVITLDKAALWTDGRYHLQASQQLDLAHWTLMKDGLPDTPTQGDWLKEQLKAGNKVGVDPFLLSHDSWKRLARDLRSHDITLVAVAENLIDTVWQDGEFLQTIGEQVRPPRPSNKVIQLDETFTGKHWQVKVEDLRRELKKKKAGSIILTALDDIAWLFNLRGSDIDFNPVFFAYAIITSSDAILFIDSNKLTPDIKQCIEGVKIMPYEDTLSYITKTLIPKEKEPIWTSADSSEAIIATIPRNLRCFLPSPVRQAKAIKNETEVQNMRECHIRDGAALCEYLAWLENMVEANPNGHDQLWEIPGADYLEACRKQQARFMGLSFPSISSSGPNGAIIHYHPSEETKRRIGKDELYLIDSGAQYLDGTTDVTRTVHFGTPTNQERECFTLVLKGHIQLALAVFPRLSRAHRLDSFARQHLWTLGLDYLHGTGHGVGMFLNVHEGPSSISPRPSPDDPGLEVGQILSNEPGYYEDNKFGIRIENLVVTRKAETKYNFSNTGYLRFETITLAPIQLKMIDVNLLSDAEIEWLNAYHATCRELVGAHLDKTGKREVKQWLLKETEKISR